jgi:Spy/CpxP family protein refolding chaperone
MKRSLVITALSAAVFAAGYIAGLRTERSRPLPAPPAPLMGEFSSRSVTPLATATPAKPNLPNAAPVRVPQNRAQLVAEIDRLRPQIDSYRRRIETLDAEFDRELAAVLTPDQQKYYSAAQQRRAERMAKGAAEVASAPAPLTDDEIDHLRQRSLYGVLWMVAPTMKHDSLVKDLKLDAEQQAKTRELLRLRREKFLAIVDSTPPPSILLSRLAPAAQRLATEPAKSK